jgi:hypothetical protein
MLSFEIIITFGGRYQGFRTKDEAFHAYKSFFLGHKPSMARASSDFFPTAAVSLLFSKDTARRLATADTPQHNGIAESLNRRLMERMRAILHQAGLPKNLLAEAILFAVWLKNHTSTKALGNITPSYEKLYKEKPNLGTVPEWDNKCGSTALTVPSWTLEHCKLDG